MSEYGGVVDFGGAPTRLSVRRALDDGGQRRGGRGYCHSAGLATLGVQEEGAPRRVPVVMVRQSNGPFWMVGDVRIDNRSELERTLEPETEIGEVIVTPEAPLGQALGDARLILAAYARWGPLCASRFRGAFSFAIWDAKRKRLVCARDHAGIRAFFYHRQGASRITLGSDLSWMFQVMEAPKNVNTTRIGDFLAGIHLDPSATFYEGINRLPAAHVLVATPDGFETTPYWAVDTLPRHTHPAVTDAACEEEFNTHFDAAVQARLPKAPPAGAFLSGGLDSSSITATANRLKADRPLHTVSAVYDELTACDERRYIHAVLKDGAYMSHFVKGEAQKPLEALQALLAVHQEPFFAPNMGVSRLLYDTAREAGVGTILHGHGGDEVVSQGYGRLKELAQQGAWLTLACELRGVSQIAGDSPWYGLLWRYFERYAVHPAANRSQPLARVVRKAAHLGRRWSARLRPSSGAPEAREEWVQPDFSDAVALPERVQKAHQNDPRGAQTEAERHARMLADPRQAHALETIARTGRHQGVETVFPFWDISLVEYCLALPSDQKLRDGWGRSILRRSMNGRVPPDVQWRRDKTDFSANLRLGLARERDHLNALLLDDLAVAKEYIRTPVIHHIRSRFVGNSDACTTSELFLLWRAAVLIAWLRQVEQKS